MKKYFALTLTAIAIATGAFAQEQKVATEPAKQTTQAKPAAPLAPVNNANTIQRAKPAQPGAPAQPARASAARPASAVLAPQPAKMTPPAETPEPKSK